MATAEAPAAEEVVEGEPKKKKPILLIALIAMTGYIWAQRKSTQWRR